MRQPEIAIVGAGLGGLLLARMLHQNGIVFCLFDSETSSSARSQGGTLDLHPETGQEALKRAGLFDEFLKAARSEDQGVRLYTRDGELVEQKREIEADRPEIDRGHLRQLLLQSIPREVVHWGQRAKQAVPLPAGGFQLQFEDGHAEGFDLVVGADGAWSSVCALLSAATPKYAGSTLYEFSIDDIDTRHPDLAGFVGHGTALAEADGKAVILQRNSNSNVRVYAAMFQQRDCDIVGAESGIEASKVTMLAEFAGWNEKILAFLQAADVFVRAWPIYALPVGHRWEHREGITLIGDAAHLMPPAGEGANLALCDAADLADALLSGEEVPDKSICLFEAKMFARAEHAAVRAMAMLSSGVDLTRPAEES